MISVLGALLPERLQMQRLRQQHVAELSCIHLNRGPRVERPPGPLTDGLISQAADPCRDLPGPARLGNARLDRLHTATEHTSNKDSPEQSAPMIIDASRQANGCGAQI